jgi:hypothetical protein
MGKQTQDAMLLCSNELLVVLAGITACYARGKGPCRLLEDL